MRKTISLAVIVILVAVLFGVTASPAAAEDSGQSYIVLFEETVPSNFAAQINRLGGTVEFTHAVGIAIVSGLSDADVATVDALNSVQSIQESGYFEFDPGFMSGEPEAVFADSDDSAKPGNGKGHGNSKKDSAEEPELVVESPVDPTTAARYSWQWNMRAVHADDAWAAGRLGSSDVTVAILDTGIDYNYPDLWYRVDLSRSVSFVPEDDALVEMYFPGAHPIADIHYHGTHVAATVSSNALIAAGVTSQTTLMGVKVCSAVLGYCPGEAIVQGILYAADNGADVINMSLGGYFNKKEYPGEVGFINRLFNYAHSKGVTIVVSAGNDASDIDHNGNEYKTYCDTAATTCVSATGPTSADDIYAGPWYNIDAPAYYTNYGRSAIEVAAPGGNSGGYVWAGCSTFSLVIPACQTGYYVVGLGGTSMAAPHVSGTAALIVEDVGKNPGQVKTTLQSSADDLGESGVDPYYGKGRLNVFNAIN